MAFLRCLEEYDVPLLFLGGCGRYALLALSGQEVPYAEFALSPVVEGDSSTKETEPHLPFRTGFVGVLSYDAFAAEGQKAADGAPNRIFHVSRSLVWDQETHSLWLNEEGSASHRDAWLSGNLLEEVLYEASRKSARLSKGGVCLQAQQSETEWISTVNRILEDIRNGEYYQINLLKFFELPDATFGQLLDRIPPFGGPYSAVVRANGLEMVSFSPERFVGWEPDDCGRIRVQARPIKGTAARGATAASDRKMLEALDSSRKERAELAMIIDLLRNDLTRICRPQTVEVLSSGHIETHPYLHHRVGVIQGVLAPQAMGQILSLILPGGSITGAPKVAAKEFIRRYEGRQRRYFMGCMMLWDPGIKRFDSSILIRTVVREGLSNRYAFAAGSGIVLESDPARESDEVDLKCRVLTQILSDG